MSNLEISQKTADAINSHGEFPTGGARLIMIRLGLRFEIRSPGMRLTSKAPKCTTILRREFGLKGNPLKLLSQFEELLIQVGVVRAGDQSTEVGPDGKLQLTAEHRRSN